MPRRLVIKGDFKVDGGHHHRLDQQARRLGFADLRACLHALLADGWSIPQLAAHLDTIPAAIRATIADHHLPASRREQLACQRRRARLPQRARLPGGPAGRPGVDA